MIRATPAFFGDMLDMIRMIKNSALHMVAILSMFCLVSRGRMYSLGEVNFIQGMLDLGNCKNSVVQQGRNNAPVFNVLNH